MTQAARHDLYGPIHKGLRYALSNLLVRLGRADFTTPEGEETLKALEAQLRLSEGHLAHEERFIHTALESRRPGASAMLERQHREHDDAFADLRALIAAVRDAAPAEKASVARALYLTFSNFVAEDFAHMAEEEEIALPILQELFTDAELQQIEADLIAAIPPEKTMQYLRLMLPAGTPDERFGFLDHVRAHAPAEAFAAILDQAARPALEPVEWNALAMRLRLAA